MKMKVKVKFPPSLKLRRTKGELAQLARAPALHAGGQGFDSLILHDFISEFGIMNSDLNPKSQIRNPKLHKVL